MAHCPRTFGASDRGRSRRRPSGCSIDNRSAYKAPYVTFQVRQESLLICRIASSIVGAARTNGRVACARSSQLCCFNTASSKKFLFTASTTASNSLANSTFSWLHCARTCARSESSWAFTPACRIASQYVSTKTVANAKAAKRNRIRCAPLKVADASAGVNTSNQLQNYDRMLNFAPAGGLKIIGDQ